MRDGGAAGTGGNGKLELPLVELPSSHPCHRCGACCRYLAIEIDVPRTPRQYDQIHWYLTHHAVSVYIDWEGEWYVEFDSLCEHLTEAATCAIYRERPKLCSDFSWETCDQTTKEPAYRFRFVRPEEFFEWLRRRRPRSFARYQAYRRKLLRSRDRGSGRVPPGKRRCAVPAHSSTSI